VIDTGIGILRRQKPVTEFFRASNAKDLNIQGTGLGLAIVKQIVEKAGGEIRAESKIRAGSKFIFVLPTSK
jgi:signal transduction histidine kinase